MAGLDLFDGFERLVQGCGDDVLMHTQTCVLWKAEHENCKGCVAELGCSKAVAMMGVSMAPLLYKPSSYEDHQRMQRDIQAKLDAILKAHSVDAVHAIDW